MIFKALLILSSKKIAPKPLSLLKLGKERICLGKLALSIPKIQAIIELIKTPKIKAPLSFIAQKIQLK